MVSSSGDLNGDGFSDVIVSALYTVNIGKIYIYFGGLQMDNIADLTMVGEFSGVKFGSSLCNAGDVNGDGISDLIVGAPSNSNDKGKAFIYYGGIQMDNEADVYLLGDYVNGGLDLQFLQPGMSMVMIFAT